MITVQNCQEFLNFETCSKCKTSFYLESGKCLANPKPSIKNCKVYATIEKCDTCDDKYYKESNSLCLPVTDVPFCELYDAKANKTICLECS